MANPSGRRLPAMTRPKGRTVDYIVKDMAEAIRSGRLALGQRLIEADMVRDLGVSRGSLREAFNRLSADGLIDIIPNRGAIVRRLTRKEVADRFAIRVQLEGLAASLAAQRAIESDVRDRLISLLQAQESAETHAIAAYRRENYAIHGTIAEMSGNGQLLPMIRQLWLPASMTDLRGSLDESFYRKSANDHRRIIEAILSGDPSSAEAEMRAHLEARCVVILSLPGRVFGE